MVPTTRASSPRPSSRRTHIARSCTIGRRWYKPIYTVDLRDGGEVVLFVFMHELYHLLVKRARRNTRQKESMCDRFAARYVVERFGAVVRDEKGQLVPRDAWDFQDVEGFVKDARDRRVRKIRRAARHPIPTSVASMPSTISSAASAVPPEPIEPIPERNRPGDQLLLFDM